jgi:hypothetical protein
MLEKGRMLAIGVVAAGVMGFGAPMAHAATTILTPGNATGANLPNVNQVPNLPNVNQAPNLPDVHHPDMHMPGGQGGSNTGFINANNDQVNGNACDDTVPVNVLGGQLPDNGAAVVYNLGSFGTANFSNDRATTNCGIAAKQVNDGHADNHGGLVNANNDQVNGNACDDSVPVNVLGGQLPDNSSSQIFNLFSGLDISGSNSSTTTNCGIAAEQVNGANGHGHHGH